MSHGFFHYGCWEQTLFPALCESWVLSLVYSDGIFPSHTATISTELNIREGLSANFQNFFLSPFLPMLLFLESQFYLLNSGICQPLSGFTFFCCSQELSQSGQLGNLRSPLDCFLFLNDYYFLLPAIGALSIFFIFIYIVYVLFVCLFSLFVLVRRENQPLLILSWLEAEALQLIF